MRRDQRREERPQKTVQDLVWDRHLRGVRDVYELLAESLPEEFRERVKRVQRLVEDSLFSARRELSGTSRAERDEPSRAE